MMRLFFLLLSLTVILLNSYLHHNTFQLCMDYKCCVVLCCVVLCCVVLCCVVLCCVVLCCVVLWNRFEWFFYLGVSFLVFTLGVSRCSLDKILILLQGVLEEQIAFAAFIALGLLLHHVPIMFAKVGVAHFRGYHLSANIADN